MCESCLNKQVLRFEAHTFGLKSVALSSLRFYKRRISPMFPPACRFTPTCSEYMYEAIEVHGLSKGLRLGLWRLWRCQPMYEGGYDPVPPKE